MTPLSDIELNRIQRIYDEIRQLVGQDGRDRFAILHAPARFKEIPTILIGSRPGPKKLTCLNEERSWPRRNILTTRFNIYSLTATALFQRADRAFALENSQSTDISFFRAQRCQEDEEICLSRVQELIQIFKPRSIIAIGERAARIFAPNQNKPEIGKIYEYQGICCARIYHLSNLYRAPESLIKKSVEAIKRIVPPA